MKHPLVSLAKSAIDNYIESGEVISPPRGLPSEFLENKAGAFVTIEKDGNLRGCVGTYLPTQENIAKEVIRSAIAAATGDHRFGPVQKEELPSLSFTVYIIGEVKLVRDQKELDPKKYGIIIESEITKRSGLLLPDLEGIDTVERQIDIACQKGGIDPATEEISIYKFEAKKYQ